MSVGVSHVLFAHARAWCDIIYILQLVTIFRPKLRCIWLQNEDIGRLRNPLRWSQLGVKLSPEGHELRYFWTWGPSGSLWAQLQLNWCQLGFQLGNSGEVGPSWAPLGGASAQVVPPGPILQTQCDTLKTCIFTPISNAFWTLDLSWAQLWHQ